MLMNQVTQKKYSVVHLIMKVILLLQVKNFFRKANFNDYRIIGSKDNTCKIWMDKNLLKKMGEDDEF